MTSTKIIKSGEVTFKNWKESFLFFISTNEEGKLDILLEGKHSRKQWCTGFLAVDEFVSNRTNVKSVGAKSYAKLFHKILQCYLSDDDSDADDSDADDGEFWGKAERTLLSLENDALQLDLSIRFTLVVGESWSINYKFQLESISLERIRALEAKVRALEADASKESVGAAEESDGEIVNVDLGLVH
ncbi:hypothetical protein DVH05_019417 [Phytophthora capsici]|nr:hypothetical protein DVH05_019417 [Phytophthora capsici]